MDVSANYSDVIVDAEFAEKIPTATMQRAIGEICDAVLVGENLTIFFEGLSALKITSSSVEISFRFSNKTVRTETLVGDARDELPRMRTWFVLHVFAQLDQVHTLGLVPFPSDFRNYVNL